MRFSILILLILFSFTAQAQDTTATKDTVEVVKLDDAMNQNQAQQKQVQQNLQQGLTILYGQIKMLELDAEKNLIFLSSQYEEQKKMKVKGDTLFVKRKIKEVK